LFKHFERRYTYFLPITPLIEECLLVPFYVGGKAVGTIWAIMHSDRRKFDVEDERLMNVLGQFASLAYQTLASIEDLRLQMASREKAEAAVRELANRLETQVRVRTQDLERSTRDVLDTNEALEREIAERKRAKEALQVRQLNLRLLVDSIPAPVAVMTPSGEVETVNKPDLEYFGKTLEDLRNWDTSDVVHPDDLPHAIEIWREAIQTGTPYHVKERLRRFDGVYRWFEVRGFPLRDPDGRILNWCVLLTDIDDRQRAECMLAGEKRILEKVARGDSLPQILESLCRLVEEQDQDVLASLSLVDGNRLRHGAAPNLPKTYRNVIDGIAIGPCAGSCGTAAFRGEQVIVSDIATDPLWADYRDAALPHSLRACWSTPVFSSEGNVIATFAMYYREQRSPSTRHKEIIEQISHLAGVAIQRTLAEEKLRRSEAYSAEAQRLSHTGSWYWNVSTGEVAWSREYCAIFGFDFEKDKPSYQLFIERVYPEDRPNVERVLWADVREKRNFDGEYRLLLPDGSIKYLHSLGKCSLDQSGDVEYIGAVVDITEHKRAEQELRDSEERHRVVVEAASDAVISMDENGAILLANAAATRVFGYDPTELIGKPLTLLMPEYMRKLHQKGFKGYLATGERHINWQGAELSGLRKNGQEFPVEISFGELVKDGRRIFTGFIRDISERKQAEEALRRSESYLAEAQRLTHIGSWAGNIHTREIFHSSDEHSRLYGLDPESGIPSFEDLYQRVHPEDQVGLVKTFERASHDRIDVNVQYRIVLPDGSTKHVEAVGHPVLKPSGEAGEFIGFLMDVTERKRAEEERERLRQAQADLAHINRVSTMGELTASLAHEIKQPIAAATTDAKTCLRWLGRDEPDVGEAREAASRLIKDVSRASDIIGRIGTLFKKSVPNRELVDVNDLIQEMIILLRGEAVRYSISIHGDLASDLPKTMADRVQLQQVLMNLMLNGIEAMKDMGTPGELTIKSEQDENRRILVAIADTGVGLRPDQTEQVFDAFFTSKPQGTGMGLSISRSIVESHGGRLWASPNSGSGATFQFTIPIEVAAHEAA
jgi:PAS domain S-box-containing protein